MKQIVLVIIFLISPALSLNAEQRTEQEILSIAVRKLNEGTINSGRRPLTAVNNARVVMDRSDLAVVSCDGTGFVIVTKDDAVAPVLGYSDSEWDEQNAPAAFMWWLENADSILSAKPRQIKNHTIPSGLKPSVAPMLTTKWGQGVPYNGKCPENNTQDGRFSTGCVPTAIAQILNYHKYPVQGKGFHRYTTKTQVTRNGNPMTLDLSFDFGNTVFDWDNMLDSYTEGNYTNQQADAVATLMYACGVMADALYGRYDGTGAYVNKTKEGLIRYMGLPMAIYRYMGTVDSLGIEFIYTDLSNGLPVCFAGHPKITEMYDYPGHCFVFDGYDADGLVHVNWGWNGAYDGYFNLNALEPQEDHNYASQYVEMIYTIKPPQYLSSRAVHVSDAGTLASLLPESEWLSIDTLKLTGKLNGDDLRVLRRLSGRDGEAYTRYHIAHLDLLDADIVSGGENLGKYYNAPSQNNALTEEAFYQCNGIYSIALPTTLSQIGRNAFASSAVRNLYVPKNVTTFGYGAFNGGKLQQVTFEEGAKVKEFPQYCFYSCDFETFDVPASVETIGTETFSQCSYLLQINFAQEGNLESIGNSAFKGTQLESVTIPAKLKNIWDYAFSDITTLTSVTFSENSALDKISTGAFARTSITSVQIPASVRTINVVAFSTNTLRTVTFGEGSKLESIDGFEDCTRLREIRLPEGLKTIGGRAFRGCTNLRTVYLPASLQEMGQYYHSESDNEFAFKNCESLSAVYSFSENPITFNERVFWCRNSITKQFEFTNATLYVPRGTKSLYEERNAWNKFKNIVEFDPTGFGLVTEDPIGSNMWISPDGTIWRTQPARKGIYINNGKKVFIQ